jgi:NAD(P)-dependent dehydrogenase (short-subunit alcohol dehydrogenase family)
MAKAKNLINFNPDKDIPTLTDKVILITGGAFSHPCQLPNPHLLTPSIGTSGLGRGSVLALAKHNPAHIYFTGRNVTRAEAIIAEAQKISPAARLTFLKCDFTSLAATKAGIQAFAHNRLDVLICNAGIMALPPETSKDGYEIQFATNHLAHALIIKLLLPKMLQTAAQHGGDTRIIILTSVAWRIAPKGGITFKTLKSPQDFGVLGPWRRYGQSKLANILYAAELARRHPQLTTVSVHPGVVATDLVDTLGFRDKLMVYAGNGWKLNTESEGLLNQLWAAAAVEKSKLVNGAFYMPVGILAEDKLDRTASSVDLAGELWEWTEEALRGY